jgi:hypothetical protein
MIRYPQEWEWGCFAGLLLALTILAKLISAPFAAVPILAILIFAAQPWREALFHTYRPTLIAFYGTGGLLLLPFVLYVIYGELFGERLVVVEPMLINARSPLQTVIDNLGTLVSINWILNSPYLMLVGLTAALLTFREQARPLLFLLACALLPWSLTVIASGQLSTRYVQLGVLPLLLLFAGALASLFKRLPQRWGLWREWGGSWGLITLWIIFFAQPFILDAWNDPRKLHLPARDRFEYFTNFTAGYGLMPAAATLPHLERSHRSGRVEVVGLVGSCHQIRLYLDENGPVHLICAEFGWEGENMGIIADMLDQRAAAENALYLLVEPDLPFTPLDQLRVRHVVLGRFPRPFEGMTVELWQIFPQ